MLTLIISLDGIGLDFVLNLDIIESKVSAIPDWINQNPELDTNIWSRKPIKLTYTLRASDSLKWALDQLLTNHSPIKLCDDVGGIEGDVWTLSIEAEYNRINWVKPWEIRLELISSLLPLSKWQEWGIYYFKFNRLFTEFWVFSNPPKFVLKYLEKWSS